MNADDLTIAAILFTVLFTVACIIARHLPNRRTTNQPDKEQS